MLNSFFDYCILGDFFKSKPSFEDEDPNRLNEWWKYFMFIKSGSNLTIVNYQKHSPFLNTLTAGRGDSNIILEDTFSGFYNCKVPKKYSIKDTFFLKEKDDNEPEKYRNKNTHFFGFLKDHFESFKKLALLESQNVYSVRKEKEYNEFGSWELLSNNLLPFSDCIIIDNYFFHEHNDVISNNLGNILSQFEKTTPKRYNLLLITYKGGKSIIKANDLFNYLKSLKEKFSPKANISLIVSEKIEHDRNMFMNYQRIKSGSSFNYFLPGGQCIVNTELEFIPYTEPARITNANTILSAISPKIMEVIKKNNPNEVAGDCENQLLLQEDG